MKFEVTNFSRELRFAIGIVENSNKFFLSFPVTNGAVDYEEYYEISKEEYESIFEDLNNGLDLLKRCRERNEDQRLLVKPQPKRGRWN